MNPLKDLESDKWNYKTDMDKNVLFRKLDLFIYKIEGVDYGEIVSP